MCVNSNDINLARILKTYNYQNISHIKCIHTHTRARAHARVCVCVCTYEFISRCDPKVLIRVVLKEYCALHLAADTVTT